MAKRSTFSRDDFSDIEEEIEIEEEMAVSEPERVSIRNLIPALVTWRSPKTGEDYRWDGPGSEVKVLKDDVDFLLSYVRKGCCGASSSHKFELAK